MLTQEMNESFLELILVEVLSPNMLEQGLGQYEHALDAYTAAVEINRSFDNRRSVAINLNNIAWVYDQLADRGRALASYRDALAILLALASVASSGVSGQTLDLTKAIEPMQQGVPQVAVLRTVVGITYFIV